MRGFSHFQETSLPLLTLTRALYNNKVAADIATLRETYRRYASRLPGRTVLSVRLRFGGSAGRWSVGRRPTRPTREIALPSRWEEMGARSRELEELDR